MRAMTIRIWEKQWLQKTLWFTLTESQSAASCLLCSLYNPCQSARNPWFANPPASKWSSHPNTCLLAVLLLSTDQLWGNGGEGVRQTSRDLVYKWKKSRREDTLQKNKEQTSSKVIHSFTHAPWVRQKKCHRRVREIHESLLAPVFEALQ